MEFNQAYEPFRALGVSWQAIKKAPLPLLVGGGVLVITDFGGGGGGNFGSSFENNGSVDWDVMAPILIGVAGLLCCLGIVFFVISSWVRIGFANSVEDVVRTGAGDVGNVFDARGRLGAMILARVLRGLITFAAFLPYAVVVLVAALATQGFDRDKGFGLAILLAGFFVVFPIVIYVGLGLKLCDQAVALEGLRPVDSIRRSWSLVRGHRWMMLWYSIVTWIFTVIGLCGCCIGILLTGAMAEVAKSESFLALTRGPEYDGWWVRTGRAPAAAELGWGAPASPAPPSQPLGWGAPPPPPPPT